jgi:tetratricopeptide (TPR) repeat protein
MGQVYGKRGDYVNALRCLEMAVEMNPASEEALINLSLCQAMTRKYDRSIETLNRALSINPNNTLALQNLAIIYDHVGNRQKAEACRDKLKSLTGK